MNRHLARNYAPEQLKLAYRDDEEHKAPKSHVFRFQIYGIYVYGQ
jgi:hypothetical protein